MGGFLTIDYCFPYCFLEIFVGGRKSRWGIPQSPLGKTLEKDSQDAIAGNSNVLLTQCSVINS